VSLGSLYSESEPKGLYMLSNIRDMSDEELSLFLKKEAEKLDREAGYHSDHGRVNALFERAILLREVARRLSDD
jgi:hypothetical protein